MTGFPRRPLAVVLGSMSKTPVAGSIWQAMAYVVGLERLGFETYYVEAHARTPTTLMERATTTVPRSRPASSTESCGGLVWLGAGLCTRCTPMAAYMASALRALRRCLTTPPAS